MKIPALTLSVALLAGLLLFLLPPTVQAGMIGTQEVIAEQTLQVDRDKVREFLNRADVEQRLQAMDVPAALARSRVDALTPAEAAALAQRVDTLPAAGALSGTDFVIILLVALLVALIL
ncbi:PA2779 family protein [Pseudomonas sp. sp1636]|uniref:PA2779 family protein n=1 Tax=Pseudomonas sp. sp1636 TaxID=3036707 RepID=UPI0025A50E42|nr:PA2779 family protein [Pseudomonas sp. sp1636]MDM8350176.1 PA2779 family protein [Pseudomonas sp. sp1636]